jgi:hypothetical protein
MSSLWIKQIKLIYITQFLWLVVITVPYYSFVLATYLKQCLTYVLADMHLFIIFCLQRCSWFTSLGLDQENKASGQNFYLPEFITSFSHSPSLFIFLCHAQSDVLRSVFQSLKSLFRYMLFIFSFRHDMFLFLPLSLNFIIYSKSSSDISVIFSAWREVYLRFATADSSLMVFYFLMMFETCVETHLQWGLFSMSLLSSML